MMICSRVKCAVFSVCSWTLTNRVVYNQSINHQSYFICQHEELRSLPHGTRQKIDEGKTTKKADEQKNPKKSTVVERQSVTARLQRSIATRRHRLLKNVCSYVICTVCCLLQAVGSRQLPGILVTRKLRCFSYMRLRRRYATRFWNSYCRLAFANPYNLLHLGAN